ncbi:MAG: cbb3-type cytochrome c oxidase subunit I [Ilumatobacteraceae bacterium]
MSTTDLAPEHVTSADPPTERGRSAMGAPLVVAETVISASDAKVVGRSFVAVSLLVLLASTVTGALLGAARIGGEGAFLDAGALPQLFAGFRVGMVYGVMIPLLLGLAVTIVPLQLGARSLAFPRLAAAGFWAWVGGIVLIVVSLANNGGPGGGNSKMVDLFLAAHGLVVIGLAAAALSVAATVLTTRAPGMRMSRVPLFSWSALIASIGLLLALPVVLGAVIFLYVDHRYARAFFGGNEGVTDWIGFALTQPATYLFALPAIGIAAELVPTTLRTRMPLRGAVIVGLGLVGVAALAAVAQQPGFDVPWAGSNLNLDGLGDKVSDLLPYALFTLLPMLGVLIVMGVGALAAKPGPDRARPRITAAFLFAFFGLGMVFVGMLGGALTPIVDLGLQGTVFEEGAFVYVAYGAVLGGLGGVVYWAPKSTGRFVPEKPALGLALLGVLATILASLPYYAAGLFDQPAATAIFDYEGPHELWNLAVTVGHALMALVVLASLGLVIRSARRGDLAGDDPWGAQTMEWLTTSPAPAANFAETPTVMSPEPVFDLRGQPGSPRSAGGDGTETSGR